MIEMHTDAARGRPTMPAPSSAPSTGTPCSDEPSLGGPVIPNFGQGSSCEVNNGWFCTDWVSQHWHDTLEPALVQHVELTVARGRDRAS